MKAPIATGYTSTILPTSATTPIQSCEEKATIKMATMRFSSAQGASDYRKKLIEECMGMPQQTASTSPVYIPPVTGTVTNTISTNLAPAPVKPGVSAIVEPDFRNVKVYDLDAPSGSPSGSPIGIPSGISSGNAMVASGSGDSKGSSEEISEGNVQNTPSVVAVAKKPNYLLYGGIIASGILVYKIFFNKE